MAFSIPASDTLDKTIERGATATEQVAVAPARTGEPRPQPQLPRVERKSLLARLRDRPVAYAAAVLLGLIVMGAAAAPLLSPHQVNEIDTSIKHSPPSLSYPFGTDDMGRDLFLRVLYGGRISIAVGVTAVLFALVIGVIGGGISGYFGGIPGAIVMRGADVMLSIPVFLIVLLCASLLAPGFLLLCLLIGSIQWMEVARVVRSVVISTKENEFVDAARALGAPELRILFRHVLPHTSGTVFVAATLGLAQAIMIESTLSFLGFGLQPPAASWGALLRNAQGELAVAPWTSIFPGLMIFVTLFCCYILGDFLRAEADPRSPRSRLGRG